VLLEVEANMRTRLMSAVVQPQTARSTRFRRSVKWYYAYKDFSTRRTHPAPGTQHGHAQST
jgi:hypothetical protein